MERILVPLDFSECSVNALKTAAELARKSSAEILLVHAYEKPLSGITIQVEVDKKALKALHNQIMAEMDQILKLPFLEGVNVSKHFISDQRIYEILESEKFSNIDLVVMGSQGADGMRRGFMGSNAQRFVQRATCPVLILKNYAALSSLKNLVFVSNFHKETRIGFEPIKRMADLLGARIHLLKIITPINFESTKITRQLIHDFAEAFGLNNYTAEVYNEVSVLGGVMSYCSSLSDILISIETHGRRGVAHFIIGSLAEDLVNETSLPMLTTRIEGEIDEF